MQTLLLIDGNALIHRAYHAMPNFHTKDGVPTNALYGFLSMLFKSVTDFKPNYIIVCFDTPKPTFRNTLSPTYQAHRPKADDDFIKQIPLIRQTLEIAGITFLEKDGYEADDVIGTLSEKFKNVPDLRILILTGDRDIMQLVDKNVFVITPKTGLSDIAVYNEEGVEKKMGVRPNLIPDLKALMGDASDNYVGAKGIGPKTAAKLLAQYRDVNGVLTHADDIKENRIKELIISHKENIALSHELATIRKDVPIECNLEQTQFTWFNERLKEFLSSFQIKSLQERIFSTKNQPEQHSAIPEKKKATDDQIDLFS